MPSASAGLPDKPFAGHASDAGGHEHSRRPAFGKDGDVCDDPWLATSRSTSIKLNGLVQCVSYIPLVQGHSRTSDDPASTLQLRSINWATHGRGMAYFTYVVESNQAYPSIHLVNLHDMMLLNYLFGVTTRKVSINYLL